MGQIIGSGGVTLHVNLAPCVAIKEGFICVKLKLIFAGYLVGKSRSLTDILWLFEDLSCNVI